jgi:outer membrane receptor protein involved in Fe transport
LSGFFQDAGTLNLSYSAVAAQKNLAASEMYTAGYAIFEIGFVSIPLTIGRYSCTIRTGIQNIFDRAYQNHLSTLRGIIKDEPGRNYFLSATIAF